MYISFNFKPCCAAPGQWHAARSHLHFSSSSSPGPRSLWCSRPALKVIATQIKRSVYLLPKKLLLHKVSKMDIPMPVRQFVQVKQGSVHSLFQFQWGLRTARSEYFSTDLKTCIASRAVPQSSVVGCDISRSLTRPPRVTCSWTIMSNILKIGTLNNK